MAYQRKYSIFISSTYEDLIDERQALIGVALENNYIPVGMEQFHAAPASQWDIITKMIDECDYYLLIIGGRYGSIDESTNKSYTEKEYDYAKKKHIPVLAFLKRPESITEDKKDTGRDKYEKMHKLDEFRDKVKNDQNTVDFFGGTDELKYIASASFKKATEYVDDTAGWVRYKDVADIINQKVDARNRENREKEKRQAEIMEEMKNKLSDLENKLEDIKNGRFAFKEIPAITPAEIDEMFRVENEVLKIGN